VFFDVLLKLLFNEKVLYPERLRAFNP